MGNMYSPAGVREYFDEFGIEEWHRLDLDLQRQVRCEIQRRILLDSLRPGMKVVDLGCGPGRVDDIFRVR